MRLCLAVLCIVIALLLFITQHNASAAPGINQQINFQGRLLNSSGVPVADGSYNLQFKLYQDGDGATAGNPTGTLLWTEDHLNSASNGVIIKNGYLSVQLGSLTSLAGVDWNQDTIWLSINIGSTNGTCTPFSTCTPDGEMLPMKRLSSTPFSLNSARLEGKSAADFVQLQSTYPGVQQTGHLNISGTAQLGGGVVSSLLDTATAADLSIGATTAANVVIGGSTTGVNVGNNRLKVQNAAGQGSLSTVVIQGDNTGAGNAALFVDGGLNTFEAGSTSGHSAKITSAASNVGLLVQGSLGQTADLLQVQNSATTNLLRVSAAGAVTIRNTTNSTSGFQVQNASGISVLNVDTTNNRVYVGSPTVDGTGTILVFDAKNTSGDPVGVQGSMYFNATTGKFRCYDSTLWGDCGKLPKSAYFTDFTEDALVGNTIMDVWDGTMPNMTLSNINDSIIVSVSLKGRGSGTDNESNVFTVHRAIGANPTCSSTRVGIYFGGATVDDGGFGRDSPLVAVSTFRDAPGATGNVRYTLCHDGFEAFSDANSANINNVVEDVTFTLQESGA